MEWTKFINRAFVQYQNREGRPMLKTDFAEYLGIDLATLSHWLNGRRDAPNDSELLDRLAAKLGTEVYEAAGRSARLPDLPSLRRISRVLPSLPPEVQETFAAFAEQAAEAANNPDISTKTLSFQVQV